MSHNSTSAMLGRLAAGQRKVSSTEKDLEMVGEHLAAPQLTPSLNPNAELKNVLTHCLGSSSLKNGFTPLD